MIAVEISKPGPPDVLRVVERPRPSIREDEVLIRVEAAGVNRPDIMQRLGKYPPPAGASDVPGLEICGEIIATSGTTRWKTGDRVCALVAGGGYAEYCAAPAVQCLPVPPDMDATMAAAVPETYFTVWTNVFQRGRLQRGETLLVHGGTSGIGTTAIQLAKAFGAAVLATAGSDEKCGACIKLGASVAVNYKRDDFVAAVRTATDNLGADVILDIVGGDYVPRNIDCLALNGRLVQVGLIGGSRAQVDLRAVLQKRLTITGSTLRARTVDEKGALARELETHVWPLLASGAVRPVIHATFPLRQAADAHRMLESGVVIGKIVLTVE